MKKYILFYLLEDEDKNKPTSFLDLFSNSGGSSLQLPAEGGKLSDTVWLLNRDTEHDLFAKLLHIALKSKAPYEVRYLSED
jgi:hypothetical protein